MHECFALRQGRCTVLVVRKCQGADCGFHKTKKKQNADHQQALARIRSLPFDCRERILEKYYRGAHGQ